MIHASLLINLLVLVPVCTGLLLNAKAMEPVFGGKTTGREILLSIYLTILILSAALFILQPLKREFVFSLLSVQIIYKTISLILIKDKRTPVLWFNLAIAAFHSATLYLDFLKSGQFLFS